MMMIHVMIPALRLHLLTMSLTDVALYVVAR